MGNHVRQVTTWIAATSSARSPPPASLPARPLRPAVPEFSATRCRRDGPARRNRPGATPSTRSTATRCPSSLCRTRSRGRDIDRTVRGRTRVPVDFVLHQLPRRRLSSADPPTPPGAGVRCRKGIRRRGGVPPAHLRPRARHVPSPPRIRRSAGRRSDAGNWHFLRPESYEAGKELMMDSFGPEDREDRRRTVRELGVRVPALRPDLAR